MTGLEKLVESLEKERQKITNPAYLYPHAKQSDDIKMGMIAAFKIYEDKARALLAEEQANKPAEDKGKIEFPCPTCGAERFKTERRPNGDSWCRFGHKHPTKDFCPASSPRRNIEEAK